jgi:hypothetical protein
MKSKCAILITQVLLAASAYAGVSNGGGGWAVVCRSPDNQITSAVLLDLYEAQNEYGLTLTPELHSLDQEYVSYLSALRKTVDDSNPVGQNEINQLHNEMLAPANFHILAPGQQVTSMNDVGHTIQPPSGCRLEQVAYFNDDTDGLGNEEVEVDSSIWKSFDTRSQAALLMHEIIYRQYREVGDKLSENTRRVIGLLASTTPPPSNLDGVPEDAYFCTAGNDGLRQKNFEFYLYPDPKHPSKSIFQFTMLAGHTVFSINRVTTLIQVQIALLKERKTPDGLGLIKVMDPHADFNQGLPIEGSVFSSSQLIVKYVYGETLSYGLWMIRVSI